MAEPASVDVVADKVATVQASVLLRNDGSVAVDLLEVRTNCGCMSARPGWKARLVPGESTVISFGVSQCHTGLAGHP